ncbi:branched-chain amino acid ABC transporter substrate-binding protein [Legionella sp.]|uniref:branched-chain amino acid ABC transporter substrate-binding protein n=1 Tax=Legionella sp. TaxID=459 RepID=UPI003CC09F4C
MTKFLSKFWVILGVVMVFITADAVGASTNESTKKTINIGIYAPFTSKSAYIGRNMLGALEIARDQLQSVEISYEFYTLDKFSVSKKSRETLQKFIDVHHINVLLTESADTGSVVASLAKKNNLIHFCLGCDAVADGKNNFQIQSPNYKRGAVLTEMNQQFVGQFKREYFSHPVTEAGYTYDIFHLLHNSAMIAMKINSNFSSESIATSLLALEARTGLMGAFKLDGKGVFYNEKPITA